MKTFYKWCAVVCMMLLPVSLNAQMEHLQEYMERFPESQLCDVYKFCFQDRYGIEHLLTDSLAAADYISREIASADSIDWQRPLFCYPLLEYNYMRVDINYVRLGIIPMGTFVSAMLKSATPVQYDAEEWRGQWHYILELLQYVEPQPINFEEDYKAIELLLDSGRYACHHSETFNNAYRQHYRIIRMDVFKTMLQPYID